MSQSYRLRRVVSTALDAAENGLAWDVEQGLHFSYMVLDGKYPKQTSFYVEVAFDGFYRIHEDHKLVGRGKLPVDFMPRIAKILPGLPEESEDPDLPF